MAALRPLPVGSAAHRKRLEPLAWASQLSLGSPPADEPQLAWGASLMAGGSTSSLCVAPGSASFAAAEQLAGNGGMGSNDTSSLLKVLQNIPAAVAARWIGRTDGQGAEVLAPLLPGLSTSLQRR